MNFVDAALRALFTPLQKLRRLLWTVRRPRTPGIHAIALTPDRKLVLVKLRYASGWRLPGGGRGAGEEPVEAALRELREEIGLVSQGTIEVAHHAADAADLEDDLGALVIVRDTRYRPHRWSWEVQEICEAGLDALPDSLSGRTRRLIEAVRPRL